MVEKKTRRYGPYFLVGSGVVLLCSEFFIWVGNYNAWELMLIPGLETLTILYLIPIIAGVLAVSGGVGLLVKNRSETIEVRASSYLRYWAFISFLIGLNLTIIYLTRLFQLHGNYLWQNSAIYILILGLVCWFLGIVLIASHGVEITYHSEK